MEFEFQSEIPAEHATVIPKQYAGLYAKSEDGKSFRMDEMLSKRLDTSGLTSALDKERKANREKDKALGAYSKLGKTPEEIAEKIAALEKSGGEGADVAKRIEKLKAEMVQAHQAELEKERGVSTKMRASLDKHLIDAEATAALAEAKGTPVLLLPHVRSQVKVFEEDGQFVARVVDKEGDPRTNGKTGGYMTIKELVAEMKKSPDYAPAFAAAGTSGGGKQPGSSSNSGGMPGSMTPTQKIARGLENRQK
jgi:hypothetical protein